jgi:hypothetical protein
MRTNKEGSRLGRKAAAPRKDSNPFLRKPVPQIGVEREDLGGSRFSEQRRLNRPARRLLSKQSYASIPDDDGDFDMAMATATAAPGSCHASPSPTELERHLSLMDLIAVGIGGTVGSGLFVLAGLVANTYAGPSAILSWFVSGLTACLSGCCYAELSGRIPVAGGAYACKISSIFCVRLCKNKISTRMLL